MKIITTDGKEWTVKYRQNQESITNEFGTNSLNYPDFVGSKLFQNSSSSDIYSLNFTIHQSEFVGFKESIKKFNTIPEDAVNHPIYGKLTHIVLEHNLWGSIKGSIIGSISYGTASEADIPCSCTFQEHTEDNPVEKRDVEIENEDAFSAIDTETGLNFDVDLSASDVSTISNFADSLNSIYSSIQNSAVVSALNDLKSAISTALIDSQKLMNSVKNVLALPNQLLSFNLTNRIELLKSQATAIKNVPVNSFNLALFNANSLAYNSGVTSRTAFVSEAAQAAAAGLKTVPL